MDSPLLPTLRGRNQPQSPDSPTQLLADLSLGGDDTIHAPLAPPLPPSVTLTDPHNPGKVLNGKSSANGPSSSHGRGEASTPGAFSGQGTGLSSASGSAWGQRSHGTTQGYGGTGGNAASGAGERTNQQLEPSGAAGQTGKGKSRFSFAPGAMGGGGRQRELSGREGFAGAVDADDLLDDEEDQEDEPGEDDTIHVSTNAVHVRQSTAKNSAERDDKLRESLYELRQMNEVFDRFLGALESARGHNERLASRISQTSELLDQYTSLLGQAEHTQRLLANPAWTGAKDDIAALEAEETAREEAEARAAAEARQAAEARRPVEGKTRGGTPGRGAVRGRGVLRGTTRGRGGASAAAGPGRQSMLKPPTTVVRKTGAGAGTTIASTNIAGGNLYANVKSSGYGPKPRAT